MHQVPIVVDYCTKYEQNQPIFFGGIATKIKFKKDIARITQIWHRARYFYMHLQHMVPDYCMNKINPFFAAILHQVHEMCDKSGHTYSNLAQGQILFCKHDQCMVPDNSTKYEQNHHILFRDIATNTQNL